MTQTWGTHSSDHFRMAKLLPVHSTTEEVRLLYDVPRLLYDADMGHTGKSGVAGSNVVQSGTVRCSALQCVAAQCVLYMCVFFVSVFCFV